jgi:L-fuconolactonase
MKTVDTHTHFYDPTREQGVPWPPRDNETLYRTVLPEDFRAVAQSSGVYHTVVVEASTWIDDNRWVLDLAHEDEAVVAVVGYLDPTSPNFDAELSRFASDRLFRGIRARGLPTHRLLDPRTVGSLRSLADADLSVDLLAQPGDLGDVARLADSLPSLRIVLDHVAHVPIDGHPPNPRWAEGMRDVATRRNVYCKVSRLTEAATSRPAPADPEYYKPTLDVLFEAFSAERLMYGSNWPVCEVASDYSTGFEVLRAYLNRRSDAEREAVLSETARAVYKFAV